MTVPKIEYTTVAKIIVFFLIGVGFALGHHFYYLSLDTTETGGTQAQQWVTRFGTAFAFLTKASFTAAVGFALAQQIWVTLRKKYMSVKGMDSMFAVAGSPLEFFSWEMLSKATTVYLLGAIMWLLPLASILPLGTLSVVPVLRQQVFETATPTPDFATVDKYLSYGDSAVGLPLPNLMALASASAFSMNILPLLPPDPTWVNSSWTLTFFGPSVTCGVANSSSHALIENITSTLRPTRSRDPNISFAAFSLPGPLDESRNMSNDPFPVMTSSSTATNLFILSRSGNRDYKFGDFSNIETTYLDCSLQNASYTVLFNFTNGTPRITIMPFNYTKYNVSTGGVGLTRPGSYTGVFSCFLDLLWGSIYFNDEGIYQSNRTRATQTALFGTSEMNLSSYLSTPPAFYSENGPNGVIYPGFVSPQAEAAARNRSLAEVVEELFTNITLSLFSSSAFLTDPANASTTVRTPITVTTTVNIYSYSFRYLLISYGAAALVSLVGVSIGLLAIANNGVCMENTFSTFLRTTRNRDLDRIVAKDETLGNLPLGKKLAAMKLSFLKVEDGHVAFGRKGEKIMKTVEYRGTDAESREQQTRLTSS